MTAKSALRVSTSSTQPFRTDKAGNSRTLTSEQIAEHVAAFQRAGGTVEVLGITRTLREIGRAPDAAAAPAAAPAPAPAPAPAARARKK